MNYLAHAYLSGGDNDLLFGNYIADAARNRLGNLTARELQGIALHRLIDEHTAHDPHFNRSCERVKHCFGHYASVVCDIYYDHFLSSLWSEYSQQALPAFTAGVYRLLIARRDRVPQRLLRILPHMISYNWLERYGDLRHLPRFFYGLSRRARFESNMEHATKVLIEYYPLLQKDFRDFMPGVRALADDFIADQCCTQQKI